MIHPHYFQLMLQTFIKTQININAVLWQSDLHPFKMCLSSNFICRIELEFSDFSHGSVHPKQKYQHF